MNHEQWTELLAATHGHTLRRWRVEWFDMEGGGCYIITGDGGKNPARQALAAAAPDLLAEVERLRGWMVWLLDADDYNAAEACREMCQDALTGAEVPK